MIKKLALIVVMLCLNAAALAMTPHQPTNSADLPSSIRTILDNAKPNTNIGVIVTNAKTNRVLFHRHADFLYMPASTMKLFTAVAALHYLGPNYQFFTGTLTDGSIKKHSLNGNLTIKFSGDPELTTDDINRLITKLKDLGINNITGHVYIDKSAYNFVPYPPGMMWDDLSYGYAAPVSAIIINRNDFILHFVPAKTGQGHPKLIPVLPANVAQFTNSIKTTPHLVKKCPLTIYSDIHNHYHLAGCLNRAWGKQRRTLAIRDPLIYAKVLIRQALQDNNITFKGSITTHKARGSAVVLAQHKSPPLKKILKEMLKNSDNLTTNSLLKKIGQMYYKQQGGWQNGIRAVEKILAPTQINFKQNMIDDGAGMSRYNLISPRQLNQLLFYAYHNPTIKKILFKTLPVGGNDGTLAHRMRHLATGKRIRAKTGSATGISALAGYIKSRHNGPLNFVIMISGFVGKNQPYLHLEDRLCELLATHPRQRHG